MRFTQVFCDGTAHALSTMDTTVLCLVCGSISSRASDRRKFSSQESQHIVPLFREVFEEECRKQKEMVDFDSYLSQNGCMCRKWFYSSEKCLKLRESLSSNAKVAHERVLSQTPEATPCAYHPTTDVLPLPKQSLMSMPTTL